MSPLSEPLRFSANRSGAQRIAFNGRVGEGQRHNLGFAAIGRLDRDVVVDDSCLRLGRLSQLVKVAPLSSDNSLVSAAVTCSGVAAEKAGPARPAVNATTATVRDQRLEIVI